MHWEDQRHLGLCLGYVPALRRVQGLRWRHNPACLSSPQCTATILNPFNRSRSWNNRHHNEILSDPRDCRQVNHIWYLYKICCLIIMIFEILFWNMQFAATLLFMLDTRSHADFISVKRLQCCWNLVGYLSDVIWFRRDIKWLIARGIWTQMSSLSVSTGDAVSLAMVSLKSQFITFIMVQVI